MSTKSDSARLTRGEKTTVLVYVSLLIVVIAFLAAALVGAPVA